MQLRRVLSLSRDQRSLRALNRGRLLPPLLLPHKKIPLPDDQSRLQKPAKAALPYKQSPLHKETMHQLISRVQSANAQWAEDVKLAEPSFFEELAKGQAPKILWLGCSDSRVPESVIMAARPGDIFVHRNIANQFHPDDDSALSVLAYAVDTVKVEHGESWLPKRAPSVNCSNLVSFLGTIFGSAEQLL
ncbi:hypothetical protein FRC03_011145 [Tulasnella sp. 419]|nr:hypothetical protein FRC03_011145 [Tulasnella sp. 419]